MENFKIGDIVLVDDIMRYYDIYIIKDIYLSVSANNYVILASDISEKHERIFKYEEIIGKIELTLEGVDKINDIIRKMV